MKRLPSLALGLILVACGIEKEPPIVPDYGPEAGGKEDSATRPAVTIRIGYSQTVSVELGNGVNWRAFQFAGYKGQVVNAYAQGLNGTDTVLYLYKVSRLTGRPYDGPIGYNDDDAQGGWALQKTGSWNPYSSAIFNATLPEDRDYALVLTTYHQAGGSALVEVVGLNAIYPSTIPHFAGSGTPTPIHFAVDGQPVLDANQYPVSSQLSAVVHGGSNTNYVVGTAIYKALPEDLTTVMADSAQRNALTYGLLLGDANTNGYDASWTPIRAADAVNELMNAFTPDGDDGLRQLVTFVLKSMFADSAFRASDVQVYRIHWDNADDTSADGVVAVKSSTGEIRVLSLDSPP
jgi:hypothetical protein